MELAFRRWGSRDPQDLSPPKPKIVLLHGLGGTGALWRPIAAHLEERFDVLAPDQRGHGNSRIPEPSGGRLSPRYAPTDYAQDVVDTMSALDFHPAWIIGHSMGARTAAALAYLKPEWTQGLILVDLGFDGLAGGGLGQSLAEFIRILPERFASRAEARQFMEAHCPDGSIAQYLMAVSVALPEDQGGGITFPFDHAALIQTIEAARGTTIRHWIENASERGIPTLALRGEQSRVWSAEDFAREKAYFSAPRWRGLVRLEEVAGAGHGLPFEKRSAFLEHLYRIV